MMETPILRAIERREQAYVPPVVISRQDFLTHYWDYKPGHHVTLLAPTQWGKTTLCYQLLSATATPDLPAFVLVVKPRDAVVSEWGKRLRYQTIRRWPPPWHHRLTKPRGYNVWPPHTFDPDVDDKTHRAFFRRVLMDCYRRGKRIVFCDESTGLTDDLNLKTEVVKIHKRGASMGCGMWISDQRPFYVVQTAYSQAEHLFLGNDPDVRDRKRYGEIGGIDPYIVDRATLGLQKYQWLYIRRTGPEMCIIDSEGKTA